MDFRTCFDIIIALSNKCFRAGSNGKCMAHILCVPIFYKERTYSYSFANSY